MKKLIFLIFIIPYVTLAQPVIERVEPPFWWVDMYNSELQIMIHEDNIGRLKPELNYQGISIQRMVSVESDNYLFIYLKVNRDARPGIMSIQFKNSKDEVVKSINYPLKQRTKKPDQIEGYDNSDVMYLITPDRFANGDTENDSVEGMSEKSNRNDKWGRHGGDIRGIINHLDYIADLGFTSIWLNPILENNQPKSSYHGYSTTDFYQVDRRFGSNEEYKELVKKAGQKDLKIIMDMIMNHCGSGHWWMEDLPTKNWINNPNNFFRTNHRRSILHDPYASNYDLEHFSDGWFVNTMPDLNQRNPLLADYLIQNTIWWIEYLGLAGIRMDTYPYSDREFMQDWTCAIMDEYPNFNICGEEWSLNPAILAYWQKGKVNSDGYSSCLPGLLDFPMQNALKNALLEEESHGKGMINLYDMLSNDFQYADPYKHVIFPDNHDMSRIFTQLNEDVDLLKLAFVYFSTMRGTPQFYYGTEILMSNTGDNSHGNIRSDLPGGWESDPINAFTGKALTDQQIEFRAFVKKLLNWRKRATSIHQGQMVHFIPANGVYVYFRFDQNEKIMVVLNKTVEDQEVILAPFSEMLNEYSSGLDILTDNEIILQDKLKIGPKKALILKIS